MGGDRASSPPRVCLTPTIVLSPNAAEMPRTTRPPTIFPALATMTAALAHTEPEPGEGNAEPEPGSVEVVEESQDPSSPARQQETDNVYEKSNSWCVPSETPTSPSWCVPSETLTTSSSLPSRASSGASAVTDFGQKLDQSIAVQMAILKELKEVKMELQRKRQRSPE
eukprot:s221_g16.t1